MAHAVHLHLGGAGRVRAAPPSGRLRAATTERPLMAVRVSVLVLAVVLLDGLVGLAALELQPSWFAGLRADAPSGRPAPMPRRRALPSSPSLPGPGTAAAPRAPAAPAAPAATPPARSVGATHAPGARRFGFVTATPSVATYAVPEATYTIAFAVDQPCWVVLRTPPGAPSPAFAATLVPSRPTAITVRGAASVMVAARAVAIEIREGTRTVGRIEAPVVGLTYRFVPQAG